MAPAPYLNIGIFKTRITDTNTVADEEVGIWRAEAGKILRYVKASAPINQYMAVAFDTTVTTAALMGNQVRTTQVAADPFYGIAEVTLPNLGFGWVTVYGPATARVATATVPGVYLAASTASGILTTAVGASGFAAIALQTGLSAGSAIYVKNL